MSSKSKKYITIQEMALFAMFGTLMFASKIIMEILPNIHLLGMFTMLFTVVFRTKALLPIYVYVLLNGIYAGFAIWWIPYLYVWTLLWGVTMLIPRRIPKWLAMIIYPLICGLHGLCYGIIYSPAQALFFGLNFEQTIAWIAAGLPFDITHAVGNLFAGVLVYPLSQLLRRILKMPIK